MYILTILGWVLVTFIGLGALSISTLIAVLHMHFLGFKKELTDSWITLGVLILTSFSVVYYSLLNIPF